MSDVSELVVARSFSYPFEAELARGALEAAGIDASIRNANVVRIDWFLSNAVGGVCLMVPREELDRAREVLESQAEPAEDLGEAEVMRCPRCGGTATEMIHPPLGARWMAWIWVVLSVDAWFMLRRRRCEACGHTWKVGR